MHPLLDKTIVAVHLATDKQAIRFDVIEGEPIVARADGDCCSYTWIESLDAPQLLIGGRVIAVEDLAMPGQGQSDRDYESVAYYGVKISTTKGDCVIDYRNASNGYYGGNLSWPGDSFYGGVYGQNVSTEDYRQLV